MSKLFKSTVLAMILCFLIFGKMSTKTVQAAVDCNEAGVICKSGDLLGDETWSPGNIYVILEPSVTVPAGVTLTIEAGTIVKFNGGHTVLIIDGTLIVAGTAGNPAYLTSVKDDSIGGDTDHDSIPPIAGDWARVYFRSGSSGSLSYVELRYGGNVDVGHGLLYTENNTDVSVDHGIFKNSETCAINSSPSDEPTLTGMVPGDFAGSLYNGLCFRGEPIEVNATWDETEVAYVLLGDLFVVSGSTLTWGPGIVIKPKDNNIVVRVAGILNGSGTSTARVYVTSINDDSVGGQTNNNADPPVAGQWGSLYFRAGSVGILDQIVLTYGGTPYGAIYVENGSLQLKNCDLRKNRRGLGNLGMSGAAPEVTISGCNIYENTEYGVYNASSSHWFNAQNNWWGSSSGPNDPSPPGIDGDYNNGTGDRVSDYVKYRPWIGSSGKYEVFSPIIFQTYLP